MPAANVICLVIDRLQAGSLGPYGNTWMQTPQWNRLAGEAFLLDQALSDSPALSDLYRSFWYGEPGGVSPRCPTTADGSLPELLRKRGTHTVLLTDDPAVADLAVAEPFSERILLPAENFTMPTESIDQTQFAQFFAAAADLLLAGDEPCLLWLHSRGMAGPWDAPFELRAQYADEVDPAPPDFTAPPECWLAEDFDPDELLGITHAYAGQVSLLDSCLGVFLDAFRDSPLATTTLLAVLGLRGYPLGEHRRVGPCDEPLYNETVHVPWLLRFPDGLGAMDHSPALVQPADLRATLVDWCGFEVPRESSSASSLMPLVRGQRTALRDHVVLRSRNDRALRTPAWHYRQPRDETAPAELYSKPSDRWEVNEVADRMPEVIAACRETLIQLEAGTAQSDAALPEILVTEVD